LDYALRQKSQGNPKMVTVTVFLPSKARGTCQKTSNAVSDDMTVCRSQAVVEWCAKYDEGRLASLLALGGPIWNKVVSRLFRTKKKKYRMPLLLETAVKMPLFDKGSQFKATLLLIAITITIGTNTYLLNNPKPIYSRGICGCAVTKVTIGQTHHFIVYGSCPTP
jgi:hypothetical protein